MLLIWTILLQALAMLLAGCNQAPAGPSRFQLDERGYPERVSESTVVSPGMEEYEFFLNRSRRGWPSGGSPVSIRTDEASAP